MKYYYYDLEVYKNYFLACFREHGSLDFITFELSETKNEIKELRSFLNLTTASTFFIGFNIIHYDNVILNFILKESNITTLQIKNLSDDIIADRFDLYKRYKGKNSWTSVDLFLYWSKMLRLSKQISLKSLAVAINHPKIQELPYLPSTILTFEEQEQVKKYCYNDVEIVENLTVVLKDKISLRKEYSKKLNDLRMFSYDDIKLGLSVINFKLQENKLKSIYDYKPDLTIFDRVIDISTLILDKIEFKTKEFNTVLSFYKDLKIYPKGDKFSYKFRFDNKIYSLGQGGLHSDETPEIFKEGEYLLKEKDVVSYYPNLLIRNKWCPPQFPMKFIDIYENIYNERVLAKQTGDKLTNETNKLALNGFTGLLKNQYSPACSPLTNLAITINGQLSLLMLIEEANLNGIQVFAANTDGVVFKIKPEQQELLDQICHKWEKIHNLELEETHYKAFFKRDINNFLAVTNKGSIKSKGAFSIQKPLIDSQDFLIIPSVLRKYFLEGISVEESIYSETNIYLFCASFKVAKKYDVIHNRQKQQQLNRFYPSLNGHFLFKKNRLLKEKNLENLLVDSPVVLFNTYEKKDIKDYHINYNFFIQKCKSTIQQLEYVDKQLNLF